MPFVPTPHADATPMTWASVSANLTGARDWANAIPNADVLASAIRREHLARPLVQGFPVEGSEGRFQCLYRDQHGLGGPDTLWRNQWAPVPDRFVIRPRHVNAQTRRWVLPIGRTVIAPVDGGAGLVHCTFDTHVRTPYGGPYYPDGAGAGGLAGIFGVRMYNWDTGVDDPVVGALRHMYPPMSATGGAPVGTAGPWTDKVMLGGPFSVPTGNHEVSLYLVYYKDAAGDDIQQIDVTRVQFEVELFGLEP